MLERYKAAFDVHELSAIADPVHFLKTEGPAITAVSTTGFDGLDNAVMAALPNLEIISCFGVGYDGIDAAEAARRGIMVTHTPDVLNADVANTAIMLMLAVSRRLLLDDAYVRAGRWPKEGQAPLRKSIEGARVGMLGLGRIGMAIAAKLAAFNCRIAYHARNPRPGVTFAYYPDPVSLARDSDYLIVITPGGDGTRKLVGKAVIEALGPDGTLISLARGSVVDEAEMVSALADGRLGAAGLDVYENEPHVPEALFAMENVVLLPHVGSATEETRHSMAMLTITNIERFFAEGRAETPVPECAGLQDRQARSARRLDFRRG